MEQGREFSISLNRFHKITTLLVLSLPVLLFILGLVLETALLYGALVVGVICIVCYLFAPQKYLVTSDRVVVWRLGPKIVIPASTIEIAEPIELTNAIRTCGAGGFFGSYGWFYSSQLGNFHAYITRSDSLVVLRLKDAKPVVLSPDDSYEFIAAVNEVAGKV